MAVIFKELDPQHCDRSHHNHADDVNSSCGDLVKHVEGVTRCSLKPHTPLTRHKACGWQWEMSW